MTKKTVLQSIKKTLFLIVLFLSFTNQLYSQYTANPKTTNQGDSYWNTSILTMTCLIDGSTGDFFITKTDGGNFSSSGVMHLFAYRTGYSDYIPIESKTVSAGDSYIEFSHNLNIWNNIEFPIIFYADYFVSGNDGWAEVGPIYIEKIPQPSVSLTNPNSGTFQVGQTMNIQWSSTNQNHHGIYLYEGGTNESNQIAMIKLTNHTNDVGEQNYSWEITSTVTDAYGTTHTLNGNNYKIKIVIWSTDDKPDAVTYEYSSNYLTINADEPNPTVELITPNSGTYQVGENMNIRWSSTNQNHHGIYLYRGGTSESNQIAMLNLTDNTNDNEVQYFNWIVKETVTDGTNSYTLDGNDYKIKVAIWNSEGEAIGDYSYSDITINPLNNSPQLSLSTPSLSFENVLVGESSAPQSFTITNTGTNTLTVSDINFPNSFSGTGFLSGTIAPGVSKQVDVTFSPVSPVTYVEPITVNSNATSGYNKVTVNGTGTSDGTCDFTDVPYDHYAYNAVSYLCGEGALDDDGYCQPDEPITRAALAKLAYHSIQLYQTPFADNFPSPFQDLQDNTKWYYSFAKNLIYLEYQDGVAPFDKTLFNFYASNTISRAHALKVLIETWNIPLQTGTNLPFTDVSQSHKAYDYVYTAWALGIIDDNAEHLFKPSSPVKRGKIFVMIHRLMDLLPAITAPVPTEDDFFIPGNYTPENFASFKGLHSGNFNFYTKTSFAISSIGIPLSFEHTYNSYLTEMQESLTPLKPLGKAWNHPYNSYIMEVPGDDGVAADFRIVVALPNSGFHVYRFTGGAYQCVTKGVYNTLQKPTSDKFTITTKNQIVYTYQKIAGSADDFPFVLVSVHDRNGNTLSINYENSAYKSGFYRINNVTGTAGRKLMFYYHNSTDLISHITDPIGRTVYFTFDTYNVTSDEPKLISFKDAKGNTSHYNYGNTKIDEFLLLSIQLPKGNIVTNTYENKKLMSTQTNGNNPTSFNYERHYGQAGDDNYIKTTKTDPFNKVTEIDYNKSGNPHYIHTDASTVSITYNTTQTSKPDNINIDGKSVGYTYDNMGNVLAMNLPLGVYHNFQYNARNDITQYTDPRSKVYLYSYDGNSNLNQAVTPRGTTSINNNSKGLVTSSTNPAGITVSYTYDNYGNLKTTTAPEGITTSSSYDLAGRMQSFTNPNDKTISYQYDANDNLLTETFNSLTTQYGYDLNDNLTTITNANNGITSMGYDFQNDFMISVAFAGNTDQYTYEDDGRLKTHTDPKGQTFTNFYDTKGRLQSVSSGGETVSYTYDDNNNIISVTNPNGTIGFTYDALNRVTQTTDFWGNTVQYTYDLASNITGIKYPGDKTVNYTYEPDNLLSTVTDWNNHTTSYTYRNDGLLTQINYPNGTNCTYSYDNAGRMTGISWKKADATVISEYVFALDPLGNHISEQKTEPYTPAVLTFQTVNYTYNNANRITNAGSTNFTFDANGNTTAKGNRNYQFDKYDRLTSVSGDLTAQYIYDGSGNRRANTTNGIVKRYVLDLLGMTNVLMETDGSNNPQTYYVYGLGLISRIDASNQTNYYHYDFRGSTIAMTDASANITHKYQYGDFGEVLQNTEADFNPFRYVGKYGVMYEDSTLYFMRARYYDTEIGRFISEDPIWSTNLYPYADNNPINMIDYLGEDAQWSRKMDKNNDFYYRNIVVNGENILEIAHTDNPNTIIMQYEDGRQKRRYLKPQNSSKNMYSVDEQSKEILSKAFIAPTKSFYKAPIVKRNTTECIPLPKHLSMTAMDNCGRLDELNQAFITPTKSYYPANFVNKAASYFH